MLRGFKIVFQSYVGVIIFIFLSHLFQLIFNFFIIAFLTGFTFKVTTPLFQLFQVYSTIVEYLFFFMLLIFIILDFMFNFRFKDFKSFLIQKDPFFFRIQNIFIIPLIIITVFYDFLGSGFWTFNSECFVENDEISIFKTLLYFIENFLYIIYFSGIVVFITILNRIKSCFVKKQTKFIDQLEAIFLNPETKELFIEYAKYEFSIENILLYDEIKNYQNLNDKQRSKQANKIFLKYLNGEFSELEVNIPKRYTKPVRMHIDSKEIPDWDIFEQILQITKENLSDTFSRFILSNEMENYTKTRQIVEENTKLLQ